MELELKIEAGLSGWVLAEARLDPRYRQSYSSLRVRRRSRPGKVDDFPIPVMMDGRIVELVELPADTAALAWRPPDGGDFDARRITIRKPSWIELRIRMAIRVVRTWLRIGEDYRKESGLTVLRSVLNLPRAYRIASAFRLHYPLLNYREWIESFDTLEEKDLAAIRAHIARFTARPRFHVLVSAGTGDAPALQATLASLRAQLYPDFTGTVVDPASGTAHSAPEPSLHPSSLIPHPSSSTAPLSSLLSPLSKNDWVMLIHAGDILPPHALYWFACEIQALPGATVVYSDDDALEADGERTGPRFKPDWSPEHLRSTHYIGAAAVLRGDAVAMAGGVTAADCRHGNYDLLLRVIDAAGERVSHVPAVLLHRHLPEAQGTRHKAQGTSAKSDGWEDDGWCADAVRAHLARNGIAAEVSATRPGCRRVRYRLPEAPPRVSIIVPTRDAVALLRQCVDGVLAKSTYPDYEILVVDNQSSDPETLAYFTAIAAHPKVRVLRYDQPFNYSKINNFAAREARGEALCLLNNDIEVISPGWLDEMTGHLLREGVGIVGARLYYPDDRVQHVGTAVGPGGCANHVHMGIARGAPGYCSRAVIAQEFSAVTAACLLTWKRLYEELGGLNEEELTVAFNDVDYCLRAQEAGRRVIFTPHAELYHHESATRGRDDSLRKRLRATRELRYMRQRWRERLKHDPYYNLNLSYWRPDFSLTETQRIKKPWL